jgi:hypothetical protein
MSVMPELLREGLEVWARPSKTQDSLPGIVKSVEPGGPTWCYVTVEVYTPNPFAPTQTIKQVLKLNSRQISRRDVLGKPPVLPPRERILSLTVAEQVHLRSWLQRYAALNGYPELEGLVRCGELAWSWAMQRNGMEWCFDCIEAITARKDEVKK